MTLPILHCRGDGQEDWARIAKRIMVRKRNKTERLDRARLRPSRKEMARVALKMARRTRKSSNAYTRCPTRKYHPRVLATPKREATRIASIWLLLSVTLDPRSFIRSSQDRGRE
ncbi:MAG: hypothetical protein ACOYM2_18855 [Rectinemataceae bacterium]